MIYIRRWRETNLETIILINLINFYSLKTSESKEVDNYTLLCAKFPCWKDKTFWGDFHILYFTDDFLNFEFLTFRPFEFFQIRTLKRQCHEIFYNFFLSWIEPIWVTDKQSKMVFLKNSFSRRYRYTQKTWLRTLSHCAESGNWNVRKSKIV